MLAPRVAEVWLHGGADCFVVWVATLDVVKHFRSVSVSAGSSQRGLRMMRDGCTCHIGMCITWWCWLDPGVCSPCCPLANRWQCGFLGSCPQGHGPKKENIGTSGQTHVSLRSSVYHRFRSIFGSSVRSSSVCVSSGQPRATARRERQLRQWLRHERLSVRVALAKFKRHSSRAGLARETCVRRTQLHVAETTSPGVRSGLPQETAPQVWLVDPWSPGLLARLLAAVLKGGPRGEERGAGEEEEGRAGEGAGEGEDGTAAASLLRRVQHRRFALFFPSAECAARHFGRFMRLRRLHNSSEVGALPVRQFMRDVDVAVVPKVMSFFLQVLEVAQSRSMPSVTVPCFGNLNVVIACESVVETMEAESLFASTPSFNISLFHVFWASHGNRLAMSKPGRFQKCASGARNPLRKLTGVKTIQNTTPRIPPIASFSQTCFARLQRKR